MKKININKLIKIIIISTTIVILIWIYNIVQQNLTNKGINNYIKSNKYEKDKNNIYIVQKNDNNTEITYQILFDNYYFSKTTLNNNNNNTIKINYYYTKKKEIIIEYEDSYINDTTFKINVIKATFKNDKLINCEKKLNPTLKCEDLHAYATNYNNEINNIIKKYNININYLKIENNS